MVGSIWNAGWMDCAAEGVIESLIFAGKGREGGGGEVKKEREQKKRNRKGRGLLEFLRSG